jgi:hypothetical protein
MTKPNAGWYGYSVTLVWSLVGLGVTSASGPLSCEKGRAGEDGNYWRILCGEICHVTEGAADDGDRESPPAQVGLPSPIASLLAPEKEEVVPQYDFRTLETQRRDPIQDLWIELKRPEGSSWRLQHPLPDSWGVLTSSLAIQGMSGDWEDSPEVRKWQTEEAFRLSLGRSLYLFGQVGAGCESVATQEQNVVGRTGVAWNLPAWLGGDIQLRSGPVRTYTDPLRLERMRERSEFLVEVQGRWPLLGLLNLEYSGTAIPALTPAEHDRLRQDLRFTLPLGRVGRIHLGAKHNWENLMVPKPLMDGTEVYLGLSVKQ